MRDRETTVRGRELGEGIRLAMESAGVKASQVARHLDWSPSRVSRLLSGKRGGSPFDVLAVLAVCGVRSEERERLLALSFEHEQPNWLQLPKQLRTLIDHEIKATRFKEFEYTMIPGLLQTEAYARALITEASSLPPDGIHNRVRARLGRQKLLNSENPPACTFFIHEFALRLPVGGSEVMSEQLHKLLRLSVRPNLILRMVPTSLGAHPAIRGSFRLMEFADINPVTYIETETAGIFLGTPEETRVYRSILGRLGDTALDEGQSREAIAALAVELYSDGDDHEALEEE